MSWSDEQRQVEDLIEAFHGSLLAAMQEPDLSHRETLLEGQIQSLFDVSRIAGISLGRTWRSLSDEERRDFVELLTQLIIATYADRFDNYDGQSFVTEAVVPVKSGFVVQTKLIRRQGDPVRLDYMFRNGRVFNVIADGVSDLSLRRADYNSVVKAEGYVALLEHMRAKIELARADP